MIIVLLKKAPIASLSVVLVDFLFKMGKNDFAQVFLEESVVKEKKMTKSINDKLWFSSFKSDEENCDKQDAKTRYHNSFVFDDC